MPLTDTFIKQVKHKGTPIGERYADGGGLYLLVKAAGKYWRMDYRLHGNRRTLAVGVYPIITLAQARAARDAAKVRLAQGVDPSDQKRADKSTAAHAAATTVEAVALEFLTLKKDSWSEAHYTRESRNIHKDLIPWLGKRPIADVTPPELLAVLRKVEARGAIESAKRVKVTASGVWGLAIATGRAERDVTLDIAKAMQPSLKGNLPALVKPAEVGPLLRDMYAYTGTPTVVAALKLASILFQRPGNLRTMRWADIDLEAGLWTIPSEDMKRNKAGKANGAPHLVPLPTQAVEIIKSLQPLNGGREFVFPGARDARDPMSEAAVTVNHYGAMYPQLGESRAQSLNSSKPCIRISAGITPHRSHLNFCQYFCQYFFKLEYKICFKIKTLRRLFGGRYAKYRKTRYQVTGSGFFLGGTK